MKQIQLPKKKKKLNNKHKAELGLGLVYCTKVKDSGGGV